MGQTVGKPVERTNSKAIIEELAPLDRSEFQTNPIEFINKRFETRASIEEWGFLWAHRILEEVFVRPGLDMQWVLNHLHKDDLASIVPQSEMEFVTLDPDSAKGNKLEELHKMLTSHLSEEQDEKEDEGLDDKLSGFRGLMEQAWKGVCHLAFGASAIDVLVESDRYFELMEELESKIRRLKKEINNELFQKKLGNIKTKFSAILRIFEKVIEGKDEFKTKQKRLDSLFYHCEEIIVLITDPESVIFDKAHYCIDFVSNFLIFHLGMLQIAEDDFGLKDYQQRRNNALKFYPTLMKSYINKAMSNYVKAIILNYHNQYSTIKEHEEIFNEMTGGVIYKIVNNKFHYIWDNTSVKEMEVDKMYYSFKEKNLVQLKPAFLCSLELPMLTRALRYGVALKLEDLFTDYAKTIETCIALLSRTSKKGDSGDDYFDYNDGGMSSKASTICTDKDEETSASYSQKYHEQRIKFISNLDKECNETKELAHQEQKKLEILYKTMVTKLIEDRDIKSEKEQAKLTQTFINKLTD